MSTGTLIEFGGLPGTGKSALAGHLAADIDAVWLRIDEIEGALRRHGLTPAQTGIAAYSVAHDVAASHLRRGLTVIADAVNPVEEARQGWRDLAASTGARHVVVETVCPDRAEHRRRVESRPGDLPGCIHPPWELVARPAAGHRPRTDDRLVLDTTDPVEVAYGQLVDHLRGAG